MKNDHQIESIAVAKMREEGYSSYLIEVARHNNSTTWRTRVECAKANAEAVV